MKGKFGADSYGGNKATYLGMKIEKVRGSDSEGIILAPDNYEEKSTILKFHTKGRGSEVAR